MSEYFKANLDIGHWAAGNNDAVEFISKHPERVLGLHVRDRMRDNGPEMPLGKGDAQIKGCLRLIREKQYPIHCTIELLYGFLRPSVEEVKSGLEYCKSVLA